MQLGDKNNKFFQLAATIKKRKDITWKYRVNMEIGSMTKKMFFQVITSEFCSQCLQLFHSSKTYLWRII